MENFHKVRDRFYSLVLRADVGIIDVSWGLKDQKTQAITRLTNQADLEPHGIMRLAAPIASGRVRSAVAANLETLKQLLEGEPSG